MKVLKEYKIGDLIPTEAKYWGLRTIYTRSFLGIFGGGEPIGCVFIYEVPAELVPPTLPTKSKKDPCKCRECRWEARHQQLKDLACDF